MKIICLCCGHKVALGDDYDDYEGQVKCFACSAILEIRTQEGKIRAVEFVRVVPRPSAEEVFERSRG